MLRKKVLEKNAVIQMDDLPTIKGFKAPLLQVFQNLVDNALKYSRNDVPPTIKIRAEELANHWQFEVEDNGIGIKEEYFDKIFTIFQRLHRINEYSGTGMGLAITKKIVESLGGEIIVKQAKNQGCIFRFTIQK